MNTPLQKPIWDRQENEPSLWYGRFRVFLLMGPSRSVTDVFLQEKKSEKGRKIPPGNWYGASKEWCWEERAQAYDAHWIKEQDKIIAQERAKVVRSGFALQHKRIQALDRLVNKLLEMEEEDEKVWVPGQKVFWNGKSAETIDTITFNHQLYTLIRKYLGDIALEMGERKQKIEVEDVGTTDEKELH